jgi:hypothetical protein
MKTILHVNQHIIKANKKNGESSPPLTMKTYKSNSKCFEVEVGYSELDKNWKETWVPIAKVKYSPDKPQSCGATVWIEGLSDNFKVVK